MRISRRSSTGSWQQPRPCDAMASGGMSRPRPTSRSSGECCRKSWHIVSGARQSPDDNALRLELKTFGSSCPRLSRASASCLPCDVKDVDGRDISAFTRVFNALCPAMTWKGHGSSQRKPTLPVLLLRNIEQLAAHEIHRRFVVELDVVER